VEDRKKGYSGSNQGEVIVGDYRVFAEKGARGLIDHLQLITGKYLIVLYLGYGQLLTYFERQLLEGIFVALLADNEDPRKYKESFSLIKKRYKDYAEQLVKRLTKSY